MISKAKTVIVGGGVAGLSAAHFLEGAAPLYEQQHSVGGLCQQILVDGFRFDAVPHVLHFRDSAVRQLISRLVCGRLRSYRRQAGIRCHGTTVRYPFQAHLYGLPAAVIEECVQGRLNAIRAHPRPDTSTFERWIESAFGAGIARHFMEPYNTKFWTLPPSELTCEWVDDLVPVPTLEETIRGASANDPAEYGYNTEFWYPSSGGLGAILEALLRQVPSLQLGKRLIRIDTSAQRLCFSEGDEVSYDALLSSVPLPALRRLLDPLPAELAQALASLRWTSITVVHLGVKGAPPAPWHWVYTPDPELVFYRVGLPSSYSPDAAPEGYHTLSAEIAHAPWRPVAHTDLTARVARDLIRLTLLRDERDIAVVRMSHLPYGYPIYDRNYAWATTLIRSYLRRHGILPIGRFGSWRYLSMEQALLDGQQAANTTLHQLELECDPCQQILAQ